MNGVYDLDEGIRRLQAFEAAGADCLYLPLPPDMDGQARVCAAVSKPVNALAAGSFTGVTREAFAKIGVARISLGAALARATHLVIHDAAKAMFEDGDFSLPGASPPGAPSIDALLEKGAR